jgi:hypothetical protein
MTPSFEHFELKLISPSFDSPLTTYLCDDCGAYAMLAEEMGIPASECHFAWFGMGDCWHATLACEKLAVRKQPRVE